MTDTDKETIEFLERKIEDMQTVVDNLRRSLVKQHNRVVALEDELRKKESAPKWVAPISQALADGGEKAKKGAK